MTNLSQAPDGMHGYHDNNVAVRTLMIVFTSIALYNAIELLILLFLTFTHYRGLYFWTLLLSVIAGVVPHAIGYLLGFFTLAPLWFSLTLSTIGFYVMVPGQSLVLYSRLHLVVNNNKVLRFVLWLIIIDAIILLVPTTVLTFCAAYVAMPSMIRGYNVMERMQLAWFCTQEMVISGIYIVETVKLLRMMPDKDQRRSRIMYELLAINFVIILLDVCLLLVEYIGLYSLQTTLKAMVYSIKLKLEFGVLGKLVDLVQSHRSQPTSLEHEEYPVFVDPSQITSDITHAAPRELRPGGRRGWNTLSMESLPSSERRIRPSTRSTDDSVHPS
ncbi:hypothetical protein LT330_000319 [Penicillium expansum]|uniref:DUF7703 domain-containing protein n=1 Tax=Penicillium expansum TaxID=27334 RepID=A0A0A2JNI3_PENEN|nr:hypothetical protein PEX2_080030 [Penicillium expansum]KAJ5499446.1 hypothetical protein N7453_008497 [Penicillium expansum]KAK4871082.1 hypothetical protein LT330_000319 [Penicillium expansum]KGO42354.1 hypothetical protein PEXP_053060 [Penicillium expansum]KGO56396.1 hypothetical protein PEX2_080030 [Penicillium expansum]KGO73016.1 hypothetical protein PEX1_072250 [Penicillium expansum]